MSTEQKPKRFMSRDEKIELQASQLQEKQERQISEVLGQSAVEMIDGNIDPTFKIRKEEADGYVHVWTRVKHVDAGGKSFAYEDKVVMMHAKEFDLRVNSGAFETYDELKVVHDPRTQRPTAYNLKPGQVDVPGTGSTTPGLSHIKTEQLTKAMENQEKKFARMMDAAEQRLAEIQKRADDLAAADAARTKLLADKDAELAAMRDQLAKMTAASATPELTPAPVLETGGVTPAPDFKGPVTDGADLNTTTV